MKKIIVALILTLCTATVFSQEVVGNVKVSNPEIDVDIDFYDSNIGMAAVVELITVHLESSPSKSLITVDEEVANSLMKVMFNQDFDESDLSLTWGSMTQYIAIKYAINVNGEDYFVIHIMPEDRYWFFKYGL